MYGAYSDPFMYSDQQATTIDIQSIWEASIYQRLQVSAAMGMNPRGFTICRIPARIRRGREAFYDPSIVSIGPYHRGKKELQAMEEHKWRYLNDFLARNPNNMLRTYLEMLTELEPRARQCYFGDIGLDYNEFVEMLLLDGCFIVEFLLQSYGYSQVSHNSAAIHRNGWFVDQIWADMILLENQIPFFVVLSLFDLVMGYSSSESEDGDGNEGNENEGRERVDIVWLAAKYMKEHILPPAQNNNVPIHGHKIDHLLHLFHLQAVPPLRVTKSSNRSFSTLVKKLLKWVVLLGVIPLCVSAWKSMKSCGCVESNETLLMKNIPCATKLVEAGITFKKKENAKTFMDITFEHGVLEIPQIIIDDGRRSRLMNLVAFEQSYRKKRLLSTYVQFMDFIIDTPKDVEVLQQHGIMVSFLNSNEETAQFFNHLNDYVVPQDRDIYLTEMYIKIDKFCKENWHQYRAKLVRDYFSNPWATLSLLAAVIFLILTFLQTFFTIDVYFHPSSTSP